MCNKTFLFCYIMTIINILYSFSIEWFFKTEGNNAMACYIRTLYPHKMNGKLVQTSMGCVGVSKEAI